MGRVPEGTLQKRKKQYLHTEMNHKNERLARSQVTKAKISGTESRIKKRECKTETKVYKKKETGAKERLQHRKKDKG